jgi:hypothetical protein
MRPRPISVKKKQPTVRHSGARSRVIEMKRQGARLELKARSEEHQEPFPLFEPVYQWFSNIETGLSEFPVPGPVDYHDYRDAGRANSAGSER